MGFSVMGSSLLWAAFGASMVQSAMGQEEWVRAERAIDVPRFSRRQSYQGGWPMGISGSACPVGLVKCQSSITNPSCCPSGSSCHGLTAEYCCPGTGDCQNYVDNFPQCADPDNVLYVLSVSSADYFCCPRSQFGVLPLSGRGGYCQDIGSAIEPSRVAVKAADQQVTRTITTTSLSVATRTTTNINGVVSTIIVTSSIRLTLTQATNRFDTPTTIPSGANNNPAVQTSGNSPSTSSTNQAGNGGGGGGGGSGISTGAIAGIVIGALAVVAIFVLAWVLYRRKKPASNPNLGPGGVVGGNSPGTDYTGYAQPMEQQKDQTNYPIPVTHQSPGGSHAGLTSASSGYSPAQGTINPQHTDYGSHGGPPPAATEMQGSNHWGNSAELGTGR